MIRAIYHSVTVDRNSISWYMILYEKMSCQLMKNSEKSSDEKEKINKHMIDKWIDWSIDWSKKGKEGKIILISSLYDWMNATIWKRDVEMSAGNNQHVPTYLGYI